MEKNLAYDQRLKERLANRAVNESNVNPEAAIGNLNPSVVIERRRGLEWIISDIDDWYDIDMPA